ncbi:MAG: hypothetical protein EXS18_03860 [Verrucomicrobiae bacterium]|nr:hypothetical protein [Verrucomicrobiae bacterium]
MRLQSSGFASLVVAGLLLITTPAWAKEIKARGIRLPDPVEKTFKATFPNAEITKMEVERENGVTVYNFVFKDGGFEKETDIAADGTLVEVVVVVDVKDVPAAVRNTIQKAATGGSIERVEHTETGYETKDGKLIKLAKPITQYVAVIARGEKRAEVVVASDGAVVEPAWWDAEGNTGSADRQREKQVPENKSAK